MIYCCDHCRFVFERVGTVDTCPGCGKLSVREAEAKEKDDYIKCRAELKKETKPK